MYTVNIYRYKAIGADATSSVILYTCKCMLSGNPLAPVGNPIGAKGLPIGATGFPDRGLCIYRYIKLHWMLH